MRLDRQTWDRYLDVFYRRYLPELALTSAVIAAPSFWPLLPLHLLIFRLPRRRSGTAGAHNNQKSVIRTSVIQSPKRVGDLGKDADNFITAEKAVHGPPQRRHQGDND